MAGLAIVVLALLLVIVIKAPAVSASSHIDIVIPVTTVVRGDEGEVFELAYEEVPEELQGQSCAVTAVSQNQGSVHPNNDIGVVSGESSVLLEDVEAVPLGTVEGDGTLVLGTEIIVLLKLGPDGVFSAGINIEIDCTPPPPSTTTTTEATTTTTESEATTTTTEPESTTTIPDEVSPTSIVSSTTTIVSTTAPEVSPTDETLPFTGAESGTPAALALLFIAGGALALVGARAFRADTDE
jgi:hypothetical protein